MKMAKRILVCLLAASLMVGVFAAVAFADGADSVTEPKLNSENYADILEYYNSAVYYSQDFDGITASDTTKYTENMLINSNQNIYVRNEEGTDNNYLAMSSQGKVGRNPVYSNFFFYYDSGVTADAVVQLDVGAEASYTNYGIYLTDKKPEDDGNTKAFDVVANTLNPILKFNFNGSAAEVLYYTRVTTTNDDGSTTTEDVYEPMGTVACDSAGWVSVTVIYDADTESATVKVADFEEVVIPDVPSAACVVVGAVKDNDNKTSYVKLDNFKFYEGTRVRDVDADIQALTDEWIVDLLEYYNYEANIDIKFNIINVVDTIVGEYSFTTENTDTAAAIAQIKANSILIYAEAIEDCCATVAQLTDYTEKLDLVTFNSQYADKIPADYEDRIDAENVVRVRNAIASFDSLIAELNTIEENALRFMDEMSRINVESEDYTELRENCVAIEGYAELVDATYPGVAPVLEQFYGMRDRRDARAIAGYVDNVLSASYAVYLPAKQEYLRIADDNYSIVIEANLEEHEKIVEAKLLYQDILKANEDREIAANDYIASCEAIKSAMESEDLVALQNAVSVSEAKKAALGDVKDIESLDGMADANIYLSNAQTALKITSLRCQQFVAYVAMIDNEASLQDRFAAINAAIAVESGTDDAYENVTEAKAALLAAINAYNAEVETLNSAFSEAVDVSADLYSGANNVQRENVIAKVVAIIKAAIEYAVLPSKE